MLLGLFGAPGPDLPSAPVTGSAAPTSLPLPCSGGTPTHPEWGQWRQCPVLPTSTPAPGASCGCALCPQPHGSGVGAWALRCDLPRPLAPQRLRTGLKPVAWLASWSSLFFWVVSVSRGLGESRCGQGHLMWVCAGGVRQPSGTKGWCVNLAITCSAPMGMASRRTLWCPCPGAALAAPPACGVGTGSPSHHL